MQSTIALPGYTCAEFEALCNMPKNYIYKVIRTGRIPVYVDSQGQYRIDVFEGQAFLKAWESRAA